MRGTSERFGGYGGRLGVGHARGLLPHAVGAGQQARGGEGDHGRPHGGGGDHGQPDIGSGALGRGPGERARQ
ncbi:hypothetical protein [Nocardia sp. CC227C]|uniref:hypothetical protein n=1 Tax=Nocardia sp. CC227C TaxID=3044562 RepID=UPI00278C3448|nr:hypothetical protein [Nocardia sp. CC227C]